MQRLRRRNLLSYFPGDWDNHPPRIHSKTRLGRAVMGDLHANCGGCHNPRGSCALSEMYLRHDVNAREEKDEPAFATTVNQLTKTFEIPGVSPTFRIRPGHPDESAVYFRMGSLQPDFMMPPIGHKLVDKEALLRLRLWIQLFLSRE